MQALGAVSRTKKQVTGSYRVCRVQWNWTGAHTLPRVVEFGKVLSDVLQPLFSYDVCVWTPLISNAENCPIYLYIEPGTAVVFIFFRVIPPSDVPPPAHFPRGQ